MVIIIKYSSDDGLISTCTKSDSGIVKAWKSEETAVLSNTW